MSTLQYVLLGGTLAIPTAWIFARWNWHDFQEDPAFAILMTFGALFIVTVAYPFILGLGALGGLLWLFVQSAKPGCIRLPRRKQRVSVEDWERATMQARITELEAELGMREDQ